LRRWGIRTNVYWCPNRNAPSRDPECGGYDKGFKLKLAEPADIRPAFQGDLEIIREAITNEFGDPSLMERLGILAWSTYLNKASHFDDMKEVLVGGSIVGRVYFDPHYMCWRWRLSQASMELALELGLIESFTVDGLPRPLQVLGDAPGLREGAQAAVIDRGGRVTGLAIVKRGKFRVQSIFKGDAVKPLRKASSFSDLLKVNSFWLRTLESKAVKHVAIMAEKTRLRPVVSYSGGKDSLVALDIALKAGLEPELLFNNTGLELPPTIDNVGRVANLYGLKVVEASAGDLFWKGLEVFGPPAKDYRWSC
jgi:phosphoadenosine phosphosulfate reductase